MRRADNTKVAAGEANAIGGGSGNRTASRASTVSGGENNTASADNTTVSRGREYCPRRNATVGGGVSNTASGLSSTVAGGFANTASGTESFVGGGTSSAATGLRSVIPGGVFNNAAGDYSFAAGRRAKANHLGSFVWADSTDADYGSGAANEFRVRAAGGVKISGTPARTLETARQLMVTDTELNAANTGISLGFHHVPNVYWSGVIQSLGNGVPNELRLNPSGGTVVIGSGDLRVDGALTSGGTVPIGGIILWSGPSTRFPRAGGCATARITRRTPGTVSLLEQAPATPWERAGSSSVTLTVGNLRLTVTRSG